VKVANFMEQSHPWEANSLSFTQDFSLFVERNVH
jgi:hypothetical protein